MSSLGSQGQVNKRPLNGVLSGIKKPSQLQCDNAKCSVTVYIATVVDKLPRFTSHKRADR